MYYYNTIVYKKSISFQNEKAPNKGAFLISCDHFTIFRYISDNVMMLFVKMSELATIGMRMPKIKFFT
jgi:hypothetical protein